MYNCYNSLSIQSSNLTGFITWMQILHSSGIKTAHAYTHRYTPTQVHKHIYTHMQSDLTKIKNFLDPIKHEEVSNLKSHSSEYNINDIHFTIGNHLSFVIVHLMVLILEAPIQSMYASLARTTLYLNHLFQSPRLVLPGLQFTAEST